MEQNEFFTIDYDINVAFDTIFNNEMANFEFDAIEIDPFCYDTDSNTICSCLIEEAELWSVFLRDINGGRHCIADCKTYEAAQQLEKLILLVCYTNTQTKKQLRHNLITSEVHEAYGYFLIEDKRLSELPETEATRHPFTKCTNICHWVKANYFPHAKIAGYSIEENPTAIIGLAEGGHDFLIVDDRYIVDFWYKHVSGAHKAPIIIDKMADDKINLSRYGNPSAWEIIPL